jgi:glycerol-3-phosphate cytidylyltransferase
LKVGFTCGAFDLLHAGHALMLKECKQYCDFLIVGLQRDPSIDRPEKNRPVQSYQERNEMINSIKWVDYVVHYDTESDLYNLLSTLNIDVRILGADWEGKKFTGHDLNMKVVFNTRDHGYSTSDLRKRVYDAELKKVKNENKKNT